MSKDIVTKKKVKQGEHLLRILETTHLLHKNFTSIFKANFDVEYRRVTCTYNITIFFDMYINDTML
jgi:hypothetical protein